MTDILTKLLPIDSLVNEVLDYNLSLFEFFNQEYYKHYERKFEVEEYRIIESFFKVVNQCYNKFKGFNIHINDRNLKYFPDELLKCQQNYIKYKQIRRLIQSLDKDVKQRHKIDEAFKEKVLDNLNRYQSPKIVISYEDSGILFLTNTNWDQCKEEESTYKHLLCVGPVTTITHSWLSQSDSLMSVDFRGLSQLTSVGSQWLDHCNNLLSVNFRGLSKLTSVGSQWLDHCENLINIDFVGLSQLTQVGYNWLAHCKNLLSVDFRGLSQLNKVGGHWLALCDSLLSVDLRGVNKLTSTNPLFLFGSEYNLQSIYVNPQLQYSLRLRLNPLKKYIIVCE